MCFSTFPVSSQSLFTDSDLARAASRSEIPLARASRASISTVGKLPPLSIRAIED
ncbi:MAG TPA: hypothetical protein VMU94_26370 [Streptosporangiaceae bacterium]|nr:hypothetical protein [Streptosporangiaceae bacterium]